MGGKRGSDAGGTCGGGREGGLRRGEVDDRCMEPGVLGRAQLSSDPLSSACSFTARRKRERGDERWEDTEERNGRARVGGASPGGVAVRSRGRGCTAGGTDAAAPGGGARAHGADEAARGDGRGPAGQDGAAGRTAGWARCWLGWRCPTRVRWRSLPSEAAGLGWRSASESVIRVTHPSQVTQVT